MRTLEEARNVRHAYDMARIDADARWQASKLRSFLVGLAAITIFAIVPLFTWIWILGEKLSRRPAHPWFSELGLRILGFTTTMWLGTLILVLRWGFDLW